MGNQHRLNAPYQLFETNDQQYIAIGTPNDELFKRFMTVLHLEEFLTDERFISYVLRKQNEADLLAIIEPIVSQRDSAELESLLMGAGVPCSRMNNIKEVFEDPHMIDRGITVDVDHPVMGKMKAVRNPVLFEDESPSIRRHAPLLGEHTEEILTHLGYSKDLINHLEASGIVLLKK
jgi:crotonobetainyl-CoA:carnitine CoA-transferase CaiB-like acyl-CoA transferase